VRDQEHQANFDELAETKGVSRRLLLTGAAGAAGLVAFDILAPPAAQAAISWTHPFTQYYTIPADGEYLNWAQWRKDEGYGPHSGIDLNAPRYRQVYNCAPGEVVFAGTSYSGSPSWGTFVKVRHSDGTYTGYAHLTPGSLQVSVGQTLNGPVEIAQVGSSGGSFPAHLHLMKFTSSNALTDPTELATKPLPIPGSVNQLPNGEIDMPTGFIRASETGYIYVIRDGKLRLIGMAEWQSYLAQGYAYYNSTTAEVNALIATNGTWTV